MFRVDRKRTSITSESSVKILNRTSLEPNWSARAAIEKWLRGWLCGGPHFIVGRKDDPYLLRWYVIPRNPWLSIYIHKFMRDDEDRALHDHPWWFVSFMLKGCYWEIVTGGKWVFRRWLSVGIRRATHRHRVVLLKRGGVARQPIPCWTLVITGPRIREWGFWCPKGFVPWQQFTAPNNPGEVGRGCE